MPWPSILFLDLAGRGGFTSSPGNGLCPPLPRPAAIFFHPLLFSVRGLSRPIATLFAVVIREWLGRISFLLQCHPRWLSHLVVSCCCAQKRTVAVHDLPLSSFALSSPSSADWRVLLPRLSPSWSRSVWGGDCSYSYFFILLVNRHHLVVLYKVIKLSFLTNYRTSQAWLHSVLPLYLMSSRWTKCCKITSLATMHNSYLNMLR